ncbi:Polysaccharide deacetylase [Saccharicrinis carchari]|uniref:Polysaccharide deacetylase n=1 Tax=Saccharicrinis carchari TaxID=1168039 RepID=A0A521BYY3_SACCC|nr:polysaccharide deacetylase family protein [Saccharicrinis carchari]SMO51781.1 Polysaccharide deacetylase [Saccharicrinis carchari]
MQFGRTCSINCFVVLLLINATSCRSGSKKTDAHQKQLVIATTELPADFYAVGIVYHRFGDKRYPSTNTPPDKFEEQLKYLNQNDFKTYTASGLFKNPDNTQKKVVITIDDGLKSFYTHGWPLLQKYNCKATLFVNTESVGWSDYMSWPQLRELHKEGVEIGSHSHKHMYFLNVPEGQRVQTFLADLAVSEQLFKDSLGFVPKVYAYPYGEFDESMANVLKSRGYTLAFAQNSGVWGNQTHLYAIPRFPVAGNFVNLDSFKSKVNMKPLLVSGLSDFPIEKDVSSAVSLNLQLHFSDRIPAINCFFNNKSNNAICKRLNDSIYINTTMPSDSRRVLLTLTAKDNSGQWLWWSKLLVNTQK